MAAVTYTQLNQRRDQTMRRTAPSTAKRTVANQDEESRHQSAPQPSRLLQMQANFQKRLMKEREDKMIAIHQRRQDQAELALQRVKGSDYPPGQSVEKKGVVREFFKERRQMEKDGRSNQLPPGSHLQKMRSSQRMLYEQEQQKQNELIKYASKQPQSHLKPPDKKHGYSKSKPLAPIKRRSVGNDHQVPPLSESHYETSERLISEEDDNQAVLLSKPKRAPVSLQGKSHSDGLIVSRKYSKPKNVHDANRNVINATPPRKPLPQVKPGKKRTTNSHEKELRQPESNELSDFQKWQIEQDNQRNARLRKYEAQLAEERKAKPAAFDVSRDDEEFEGEKYYSRVDRSEAHGRRRNEYQDMMDKEKELEAMIRKHKEDLEKLQANDSSDEEENDKGGPFRAMPQRALPVQRNQRKRTPQKPTNKREPTIQKGNTDEYDRYEDRYGYYQEENQISRPFNSSRHVDPHQDEDFHGNARSTEPVNRSKQREGKSSSRYDSHTERDNHDEETNFYAQMANNESDQTSGLDLRSCPTCGRNFAADRLQKHMKICKKNSNKKRKVFDSSKHRTEGTEMSQYVKQGRHLKEPTKVS